MGDPSSRTGIEQYQAARSLLHAWLLLRQGGLCIVCLTPLDIGIPQGAWGVARALSIFCRPARAAPITATTSA